MDPIKDIVSQVVGKIADRGSNRDDKVQRVWEQVAPEMKKFTVIVGLDNGKLTIHVDSAARSYRLKLKSQTYLKCIQEESPNIKQLIFRIGKIK